MELQKCMHGEPVVQVPSHGVAKMHAWKASGALAGMRSWLLDGGFIEKKRDPTAGVPLHEVAKMHAWEASGAGMRSWLLDGGFIEKKWAPIAEVPLHEVASMRGKRTVQACSLGC